MPRPLTNHTCENPGCTAKTRQKLDGNPRKYCDPHTADSRARMKQIFADSKVQRDQRDEMFKVVLDTAMLQGDEARERANPLASARGAVMVLGPKNHRFVNYLRRVHIGDDEPQGYVVRFPALPGSHDQAQAVFETLRPLTATGEALQGLRVDVR